MMLQLRLTVLFSLLGFFTLQHASFIGDQDILTASDRQFKAGLLDSAYSGYSRLLASGYKNPHIFNMLAAISLKQQNKPMAVKWMYDGLLLYPDSKVLESNLKYIELSEELPSGPRPFLPWGVHLFSTNTWARIFLVSIVFILVGLIIGTWFNSPALRRWMSALVLVSIGLGLGSIFAAQWRYNLSKKQYGIVKINQCPVLVKPQPDAEVLMYLVPAQAMEIIEWQDGWARVKNPDDVEGFVNQDQLIRSEALGF
jgi:hypothetical protein